MEICRLAESLPLVKVSDLAIPKTAELLAEDVKKQELLQKVIDGLQSSLQTVNADEEKILNELQVKLVEV